VISVTRRYRLPAAHVLASRDLSDRENREIFGKCANANGHGHNYDFELTVTGPLDEQAGEIISPGAMDRIFDATIRERYAYRMLNELPEFEALVPTAENIAKAVYENFAPVVASESTARLVSVRVIETSHNTFEYGAP
jgi:6-pyruvoyltetrahydropterin/6-carboxytetrahydropterin synthase